MTQSDNAKQMGVGYETAWRWHRDGIIQGRRVGVHTIIAEGQKAPYRERPERVAIHARVSAAENELHLREPDRTPGHLLRCQWLSGRQDRQGRGIGCE